MHPVVLYQMGKVGSLSLIESLKHYNFKTLHLHRYYFNNNERPRELRHLFFKIKFNLTFDRFLKNNKVNVITLYRDPLPRNISSFFENLDVYFSKKERKTLDYNILKETFNKSFRFHNTPNTWFDLELHRKLDVDIFKASFNKVKGYKIIEKENINLFICTTDKINTLEKELAQFLEVGEFKLINTNIGEHKWYSDLYKEFKDRYKPSEDMLNLLYNSETIKYFYTEETIDKLKSKWLEK